MIRKLFDYLSAAMRGYEAAEDFQQSIPLRVVKLEARMAELEDRMARPGEAEQKAPLAA